jgi:hypothetical protein
MHQINRRPCELMLEATRLTRANRLIKATALIQRMLRGETEPAMTISLRDDIAPIGNKPPIIDANAEAIDETHHPHSNAASFAAPHYFPVLRDSTNRVDWPSRHGLRGWMQQPVPISPADIVPEGGKFTEATYTNTAGTRAYKLYIPSRYQSQALPLVVHAARRHSDA